MKIKKDHKTAIRLNKKVYDELKKRDITAQKIVDEFINKHFKLIVSNNEVTAKWKRK